MPIFLIEHGKICYGFKRDEIKKHYVLTCFTKVGGLAEIFNERFDKSEAKSFLSGGQSKFGFSVHYLGKQR